MTGLLSPIIQGTPATPDRQVDQRTAALRHPPAAAPLASPRAAAFPGDVRTFLSAVLIVLVALLVPAGAVAYWADHELGDADRYTAAMAPLAENPAVQE